MSRTYSLPLEKPPGSLLESIYYLEEWDLPKEHCAVLVSALKDAFEKGDNAYKLDESEMGCLLHNFKKNDAKEGKPKDGGMLGPGDVASMNEMVVHRGPDLDAGEVRHVIFLLSAPNDCSSFYHYNTQFSAPVFFGQVLLTSWEYLKGKSPPETQLHLEKVRVKRQETPERLTSS